MCHTDIPPGQTTPEVAGAEVEIPLPAGEAMPALHVTTGPDRPPVLVIPDVFGRSAFYEHLGALLAQAGFQALVVDIFFRQGPLPGARSREAAFARRAQLDEAGSLDDLRAAIGWLRERSGHARVGTIGFCMGGTFVLDLASTEDALAGVAYYGFPVPQPTLVSPPPRPMDLVGDLRGPVLAFWGDQDAAVGLENARVYARRAGEVNPAFEHEIIAGLGHGFLGSAALDDPTDPGGATWARTLGFLRTHLQQRDG
jgi:carboxymethylenebutenolidase